MFLIFPIKNASLAANPRACQRYWTDPLSYTPTCANWHWGLAVSVPKELAARNSLTSLLISMACLSGWAWHTLNHLSLINWIKYHLMLWPCLFCYYNIPQNRLYIKKEIFLRILEAWKFKSMVPANGERHHTVSPWQKYIKQEYRDPNHSASRI